MTTTDKMIKRKALYANCAARLVILKLLSANDRNRARIENAVAKFMNYADPQKRVTMLKEFLVQTKVEPIVSRYVRGAYIPDAAMRLSAKRAQIQPELISVSGKLRYINLGDNSVYP